MEISDPYPHPDLSADVGFMVSNRCSPQGAALGRRAANDGGPMDSTEPVVAAREALEEAIPCAGVAAHPVRNGPFTYTNMVCN